MLTSPVAGDQVFANVALGNAGGYTVWEDNATDGAGLGVSARRLDANLSGVNGLFRVNATATADQEKPQVAMLGDGGAVFVWQGGVQGAQKIYARFLTAAGTFRTTSDVLVSTHVGDLTEPAVAVLSGGNVVVVWSSRDQDGSLSGVYAQLLSGAGVKVGAEYRVNVTTTYNQRNPSVTALPSGGFAVSWVTEKYRRTTLATGPEGTSSDTGSGVQEYDVQVMARYFDAAGAALGGELGVSSTARMAANPSIAAGVDGTCMVVWSSRAPGVAGSRKSKDRWDVFGRSIGADRTTLGNEFRMNQHVPGDQFRPKVSVFGGNYFAVWSSLGQDGSREGVFGRALSAVGAMGDEALINTERASQQLYPAVAGNAAGKALVVWSSFMGGVESFDLYAQRVVETPGIEAPDAPFVQATGPAVLSVTWSPALGLGAVNYLLYIDGATSPVETMEDHYTLEGLQAGSMHSFKLAYRLGDGRVSELSSAGSGKVWDLDRNLDGLPDEWQAAYWPGVAKPPGAADDSDGDGASNAQELLAGTDPTRAGSVLKMEVKSTEQGQRLGWNTTPGAVYQLQVSTDLGGWVDSGPSRLAASEVDSVPLDKSGKLQVYRIIRIR